MRKLEKRILLRDYNGRAKGDIVEIGKWGGEGFIKFQTEDAGGHEGPSVHSDEYEKCRKYWWVNYESILKITKRAVLGNVRLKDML